jgi:hypothetical protein
MKTVTTIAALALISGSVIAETSIQWLPAGNQDMIASSLVTDTGAIPASRHVETAAINFAWMADADYKGQVNPGMTVESRQYWVDVSGQALAHGVKLPISAPGAVIRVSALESGSGLTLDPARLELAINDQALSGSAIESLVSGADMRAQGMLVPEDSLAFRLPDDSQAGTLQMRLGGSPDDQPLVVHVFEPNSPWVAELSAPRNHFLSDQPIRFSVNISNGDKSFSVDQVNAILINPDASQTMAINRLDDGVGLAGSVPATAISSVPGLYEAHAYVEHNINGMTVKRDLKLAFSVAPAAGRFTGLVEQNLGQGLDLNIGLEVAIGGRYQVNGEIFGTDSSGQLQPLAFAQSAAMLEAGRGSIDLAVDAQTIASTGLSAPFEVRNLQLLDQGRMFILEERERAIVIDVPTFTPEPDYRLDY